MKPLTGQPADYFAWRRVFYFTERLKDMGFPQAVAANINRPSSATATQPVSAADFEVALARLEANADLSVQVQSDLWRVAKECRALHKVLGEPLAHLLVSAEQALKDWAQEDREDCMSPLDSSMNVLELDLEQFYEATGVTRPA